MNIFRNITSNLLRAPASVPHPSGDGGGAAPAVDDRLLVERAQKGDYAAFDQLVTNHRGKIYAMIVNMVKNDADAWDLTQDAFIKAWKALAKFENRSKFSTWMFRISHNVVYDWKRKRKIESDGELDDNIFSIDRIDPSARTTPSMPESPDKEMQKSELRQQIGEALAKLSEKHREVVLLREVQGLDYKEIAEILDCSIGTVMSRLFNARKKLQTLLS
jgi:RNA polymerase sigma-70 factor (ECF subfamily)